MAAWLWMASAWATPMVTCFGSGLQVAVEERPGRPVLGIAMIIAGGAAAEEEGQAGAAHVLEHLWFRSEQGDQDVDDALVQLGASYNAFTTHDATQYATVLHRRTLRGALALEVARLADPLAGVTEEVFQSERAVVRQEMAERLDGTDGVSLALARAVLPPTHPYTRPLSGSDADLQALTLDQLRAYAARWYTRPNATLYISGALPAARVLQEVATAFGETESTAGSCPRGGVGIAAPTPPAADTAPVVESQVAGPIAVVTWAYPTRFDGVDELAAFLVDIRMRRADCGVLQQPQVSYLWCSEAVASPAKTDAAAARIRTKVRRVFADAADHQSNGHPGLVYATKYFHRRHWRTDPSRTQRIDADPSGLLLRSATHFHLHRDPLPGRPSSLKVAGVADLGRSQFTKQRARVLTLVPPSNTGTVGALAHGTRGKALPKDIVADLATLERLVEPPEVGDVSVSTLKTGLQVWVMKATQAKGEGYAEAVFPVDDSWRAHPTLYLVGTEVLAPGRGEIPKARQEAFETTGGWWTWDTNPHSWTLSAVGGSPAVGLEVLSTVLSGQPTVQSAATLKKAFRETVEVMEGPDSPRDREARVRWRQLTGGEPHPLLDSAGLEALVGLEHGEVADLVQRVVHPRNGTLLLISDSDPASALKAINAGPLGTWQRPKPSDPPSVVEWPEPAARAVFAVADPTRTAQADVTLACHIAPGGLAILMAERLLEARLNATLRSELGATYGVHANVHRPSHGRTLEVTTSVGMPRAGDAVTSLLAAIEDIGAGKVTTAELDPLKLSFARETVTLWQSVPELAAWLRGLAEQGLPPDTDANLAERLHALTPADLAEALAPCTGREVVTVVGEAKAVAKALEGTGVRVQTR